MSKALSVARSASFAKAFFFAGLVILVSSLLLVAGVAHALTQTDGGLVAGVAGGNGSRTSAAQGSVQAAKPPLATGYYMFASTVSGRKLALDTAKDSAAQNVAFRTSKPDSSLYQRFYVRHLGNSIYTVQVANSGKYLTDRKGKVVQQAFKSSKTSGVPASAQLWKVTKKSKGAAFVNVATGKALTVASATKRGAKVVTATYRKKKAQRFYPKRLKKLIPNGVYTIATNSAKLRLDVDDASWGVGANVQVWKASKTLAQRFVVKYAGSGYYRVFMAVSGRAVQSKSGAKGVGANVCMAKLNKKSAKQLWRPTVGNNGIVFANKATGCVLTVSGTSKAGANVRAAKKSGKPAQGWRLRNAQFTWGSLDVLSDVIDHVSGSGDRTLRFDPKSSGLSISEAKKKNLSDALGEAWDRDEDVSFVMVDLKTGATLSMGADRDNHGASTFKAAYVTYVFQDLVETGEESYGSVSGDTWETISYSNNDTYLSLRARFGSGGFSDWLDDVGLSGKATQPYPAMTARDLALVWAKLYAYQSSDGDYVGDWRDTFDHSYYSAIQERLGDSKTVYSKPGWYPQEGRYAALNDGAIVKGENGTYLLSIVSNVECYSERWIIRDVAEALDDIYNEWH